MLTILEAGRRPLVLLLAGALAVSGAGCTTTAGGGGTSLDGAIGRCVASAVGGALVGGLLGAAAGGRRGVLIGAGAGAVIGGAACGVLTALDAQDKARIRQAQIEAASLNQPRYISYNGSDGRVRTVSIRPTPAQAQTAGRICRQTDGEAAVAGAGQTSLPAQLICRNPNGDWVPA